MTRTFLSHALDALHYSQRSPSRWMTGLVRPPRARPRVLVQNGVLVPADWATPTPLDDLFDHPVVR